MMMASVWPDDGQCLVKKENAWCWELRTSPEVGGKEITRYGSSGKNVEAWGKDEGDPGGKGSDLLG